MRCPKCGGVTGVYDSRPTKQHTRRRRRCEDCDHAFTTHETIVVAPAAPAPPTLESVLADLQQLAQLVSDMIPPPREVAITKAELELVPEEYR